jgi:hypothetical protein
MHQLNTYCCFAAGHNDKWASSSKTQLELSRAYLANICVNTPIFAVESHIQRFAVGQFDDYRSLILSEIDYADFQSVR